MAGSPIQKELFKGITLSNLIEDGYIGYKKKDRLIQASIDAINKIVSEHDDNMDIKIGLTMPLKNFIDSGIKNDDQLIKLASIAQRQLALEMKNLSQEKNNEMFLPDEEIEFLKRIAEEGNFNSGDDSSD